ncbi:MULTISPECIES: hypothetical protein [Microbacterium]|uniref:hypothetical protein n=1 Tax=Microbacterium TaxID=33882 RepID=UPI00278ABF27|nr:MULTISPECIES: hypothetical protein [Microbacterium]MDQ1083226.1 hypothetical protein [Microbacterium sp. SORGH_AS_0344]MDQ1171496.1 hypothetical protein [Microbacterium proteolyticum]
MADSENAPASGSVWSFVAAVFVCTSPMVMFPDMPGWARAGTLVVGIALIGAGFAQLRREKSDPDRGGGAAPPA